MKISKTMIAMVVVLAFIGVAAILEVRARAAARSPAPGVIAPVPAREAPLAAPELPVRDGKPLRPGVWVG